MPKPVVIFGAGASYDAFDIENNATEEGRPGIEACRLPLTNNLFHPDYIKKGFDETGLLDHFVGEARKETSTAGNGLESFLYYFQETRVVKQSDINERWRNECQLLAVRYYLQKLVSTLHVDSTQSARKQGIKSNFIAIFWERSHAIAVRVQH